LQGRGLKVLTEFADDDLLGVARLTGLAYHGKDMSELGQILINRGVQGDANALLDLSVILQLTGQPEQAMDVQRQALAIKQHYTLKPTETNHDIRLLAIVGPGDLMTNTPLEFIAEGAGFTVELLYVAPDMPLPTEIPDHDIAICGLGELDRNQTGLFFINNLLDMLPGEILNPPLKVSRLGRDMICHDLQNVPGVDIPVTTRVSKNVLTDLANEKITAESLLKDGEFPIIVRPMDSHAGLGLEKIEQASELKDYMASNKAEYYFISRYVDYASPDGQFRKYRVVLVDGEPDLAHMGVSTHWMNHYGNAGMEESIEKREEEAHAMAEFSTGFAARHAEALKGAYENAGLDYCAIDCSETKDGKLLIFEIDSSMIIHMLDSVEMYPYKRPQMAMIFDKFTTMLKNKIAQSAKNN
jgi:glutathione synthase/RimK-type ligase-like ATP-grasp enzyme